MKDVDEAEAVANEATAEKDARFEMSQKTLEMASKGLPDCYDSKQDDKQPLKGSDKEETPDNEEGSKKPYEQKDGLYMNQTAAEMAMKPLPDDNDSEQENKNLMSNAE